MEFSNVGLFDALTSPMSRRWWRSAIRWCVHLLPVYNKCNHMVRRCLQRRKCPHKGRKTHFPAGLFCLVWPHSVLWSITPALFCLDACSKCFHSKLLSLCLYKCHLSVFQLLWQTVCTLCSRLLRCAEINLTKTKFVSRSLFQHWSDLEKTEIFFYNTCSYCFVY